MDDIPPTPRPPTPSTQPGAISPARTDDPGAIMGGLVPREVRASPVDMLAAPLDALSPDFVTMFDGKTPWWRPGAKEVAKAIGWRWAILLPLIAVALGIPVAAMLMGRFSLQFLGGEIKFMIMAIGASISIVLYAMKRAVNVRKDDFCIHCGYCVHGLGTSGQCPECGRHFNLAIIGEYKKDPHFFVDRWRALQDAPKGFAFPAGDGPTPDDGTR
jgi:hypothetical protein